MMLYCRVLELQQPQDKEWHLQVSQAGRRDAADAAIRPHFEHLAVAQSRSVAVLAARRQWLAAVCGAGLRAGAAAKRPRVQAPGGVPGEGPARQRPVGSSSNWSLVSLLYASSLNVLA